MSVLNNFLGNVDVAQVFGIDVSSANSDAQATFGSGDIVLIDSSGEGVISGIFPDSHEYSGTTGFLTSRSIIKTVDLISEGEIEGIVSGEFIPTGTNVEGQIGWDSGYMQPLASQQPEAFLRSIYLNDTPVVSADGLYNFQAAQVSISTGPPSGIVTGDMFLGVNSDEGLEKTRNINERLRGPDINDEDQNDFYYYPKVYRFFNTDLQSFRVNIKIPSLTYTKVASDPHQEQPWPDSEIGQIRGSELTFKIRYRPLRRDKGGNLDLSANRQWYGSGGAGTAPFVSTVRGLIRNAYLHPITINVNQDIVENDVVGWELEITRTTLDSIESHINNQSFVDSVTEISKNTLSYPNSAIASMSFNAEYFSQVPNRSFDMRLLKVKVPTGYDTLTRKYSSSEWDGTFQSEKKWTDNPAWIFYDLITNKRYGLGKFLGDVQVDKWTLYEIAKFCDTLVSNGEGGLEPRFTCNVLINTKEEAYKVLKDFASTFRSILYYGLGRINISMDKPRDVIAQFNNASVAEGNFTYSSTPLKSIPTVCLVRYNDKENFYKPAVEYVENTEGIRKYGIREKEVTAFACTSRSQAIRLGRWILTTELSQGETISFSAGTEGMLLRPGDVIRVTDANRSNTHHVGRAVKALANEIVLDRVVSLSNGTNYSLTLTTPSYFYDESIVSVNGQDSFSGFRNAHVQSFDFDPANMYEVSNIAISGCSEPSGTRLVYTDGGGSETMFSAVGKEIVDGATWSITTLTEKNNNLYTIVSTKENDDLSFGIEAMSHNTGKYNFIESGIFYSYIESPSNLTASPPAPHAVSLVQQDHPSSPYGSTKRIKITISPCNGLPTSCDKGTAIGYKVFIKQASSWSASDYRGSTSIPKDDYLHTTVYFDDFGAGIDPFLYYIPKSNEKYIVKVFAINSLGTLSNDGVDGQDESSNAYYEISGHFPVKDIKIHSLRLNSNYTYNEVPETGHLDGGTSYKMNKEYYNSNNSKDADVTWNTQFLNESSFNLPITYRVSIHEPSDASALPGTLLKEYTVTDNRFNFTFEKNKADITSGPKRRFDMVVTAVDENGIVSSGATDAGVNFGWDIIEVANPKPTGYYLTPRRRNYSTVAAQYSCDNIWTDQYIDSDGFVHLDLLGNNYSDIAGGYAYVSKHPFSGQDFNTDGSPKLPSDRVFANFTGENEAFKSGEYVITETNFEAPSGQVFSSNDSKITFKPDITGEFSPPYYMAIKLYDSFDKGVKDAGSNTTWNNGLLNNAGSSAIYGDGLFLGFAKDTTGVGGDIIKSSYTFSTGHSGLYLGDPDQGGNHCNTSGTFSTPIFPTKYYSANQGGFKYWIRINVNGQWEGQGVSHVKVLTQKDVMTLYDYRGFYEYSCSISQLTKGSYGPFYTYPPGGGTANLGTAPLTFPNHPESMARCRFRMGQMNEDGSIPYKYVPGGAAAGGGANNAENVYFSGVTTAYGLPFYQVTGVTLHNEIYDNSSFLTEELSRAGVAISYTKLSASTANAHYDKIDSYNERGQLIAGKNRPLRGFRRFRVYFDENNLPQPNDSEGLASYAVVGLNCWNGKYESWPSASNLTKNLLFAKDGTGIFPNSTQSYLREGDLFENIPGVWNHHPAGFGQGFGGLVKTQKYFDIHLGRMIDDSYLNEGFFGVVTTNDYGISSQLVRLPQYHDWDDSTPDQGSLHEAVYEELPFVTKTITDGGDGAGVWTEMY